MRSLKENEIKEFIKLISLLKSIRWKEFQEDSIVWNLEGDDNFSIRSFYSPLWG